jgi:hypothetical protein
VWPKLLSRIPELDFQSCHSDAAPESALKFIVVWIGDFMTTGWQGDVNPNTPRMIVLPKVYAMTNEKTIAKASSDHEQTQYLRSSR